MNINGLNFNEDITLNQLEAKIKSITPDTVSPILPTLIEI